MSNKLAADAELTQRTYPGAARAALGMIIISFGAMLGPLDSAVNIAFPAITAAFGLRISDIQWIVIVYVLMQSCFSIIFGKLGDLYGHRRVFMFGSGLAALIHAVAGFAPNYPVLVALRGLQGIAIGISMSCGPALATFLYPPASKRAALSFYTMLFGIGLAIGPVLGGWLIETFGWPAVFWYRAPIAFTALALAFLLPGDIPNKGPAPAFDYAGTLWLMLSLASFVGMLTLARQSEYAALPVAMLLIWIATAVLFVRQERKAVDPVLHVEFYKNPSFAGIQLATLSINFFNFSVFLLVPYLLVIRGDTSLIVAGLMLGLYPLGQILAGLIGSRLSKSVTSMMLVSAGLIIASFGVIASGLTGTLKTLAPLGAALFTAGFGLGTFQVGNLDLTTSILPVSARGMAGSLVNVLRLLGIIVGAAIITWVYDSLAQPDRLQQFRSTFLIMGGLELFCAIVLSRFLFRHTTPVS